MNLRLEEVIEVVSPHLIANTTIPRILDDFSTMHTRFQNELTYIKILPLIDGTRNLSQIAALAHVDIELSRIVIADLVYRRVY